VARSLPRADVIRAWVDTSCTEAGLPVRVTDGAVVTQVAALLGAAPRRRGTASVPSPASQLPDGREAAGVEAVEASSSGMDDHVIEHGGDDRVLPGQGQGLPNAA